MNIQIHPNKHETLAQCWVIVVPASNNRNLLRVLEFKKMIQEKSSKATNMKIVYKMPRSETLVQRRTNVVETLALYRRNLSSPSPNVTDVGVKLCQRFVLIVASLQFVMGLGMRLVEELGHFAQDLRVQVDNVLSADLVRLFTSCQCLPRGVHAGLSRSLQETKAHGVNN